MDEPAQRVQPPHPVSEAEPEAHSPARQKRVPGGLEGRIFMAPDFDTLPDDILASFEASIDPFEDTVM